MDEIKEAIKTVTGEIIMQAKYDPTLRAMLAAKLHDAGCDDDFITIFIHGLDVAYGIGKLDCIRSL